MKIRRETQNPEKKDRIITQLKCPGLLSALGLAVSVLAATVILSMCFGTYSELMTTLILR